MDVRFRGELERKERLVEINISEYEGRGGVNVEGNDVYGVYESVLGFGDDGVK